MKELIINIFIKALLIFTLSSLGWFLNVTSFGTAIGVAILLLVVRKVLKVASVIGGASLVIFTQGVGLFIIPLLIVCFGAWSLQIVASMTLNFTVYGFFSALVASFIINGVSDVVTKNLEN